MVLGLTLLKGTFLQLVNSLNQLSKNRAEKREVLGPFPLFSLRLFDDDLYVYTMCKHREYTEPYLLRYIMGEWQSRREQSDLERYFGKFCRSAHSDVNWPELIWPPVKVLGICQNKTLTGIGMFLVIHEEFPSS